MVLDMWQYMLQVDWTFSYLQKNKDINFYLSQRWHESTFSQNTLPNFILITLS